jgi:molecular chaperone HscB
MFTNILSLNFFELFEIPVAFEIDVSELQKKYTVLQQAVHPDRFANASDQEKRLSMQQTSHINEAYQTLKDPVARAVYLLKLKGVDINLENETTMDMAFLMEQMEMREALAEIRQHDDALDRLDDFARHVKKKMLSMTQDFSDNYESDELEASREIIRKLQFMQKAKKEISELSASLEDELM